MLRGKRLRSEDDPAAGRVHAVATDGRAHPVRMNTMGTAFHAACVRAQRLEPGGVIGANYPSVVGRHYQCHPTSSACTMTVRITQEEKTLEKKNGVF